MLRSLSEELRDQLTRPAAESGGSMTEGLGAAMALGGWDRGSAEVAGARPRQKPPRFGQRAPRG